MFGCGYGACAGVEEMEVSGGLWVENAAMTTGGLSDSTECEDVVAERQMVQVPVGYLRERRAVKLTAVEEANRRAEMAREDHKVRLKKRKRGAEQEENDLSLIHI